MAKGGTESKATEQAEQEEEEEEVRGRAQLVFN